MSNEKAVAAIDLVIASRALARLGIFDAYGHVSVRQPDRPDRFLISRSRSPELVDRDDIMEVGLDGEVKDGDRRPPFIERFIHSEIYAARPDVGAVVHGHALALMPFCVVPSLRLRPVMMSADEYGPEVPLWDIRTRFGDTDLLIVNREQGADLARTLGPAGRAALLRGHGFVAAARSAVHAIRLCKALVDNARVQLAATPFGPIEPMTPGEMAARQRTLGDDEGPGRQREFEYEATLAGLAALYEERKALRAGG